MENNVPIEMKVIAHIHTDFATKFGVPRQSGLVGALQGEIVFTEEYRNADAMRGIEDFSHLWLIWLFSRAVRSDWSPTVRPPRLGGNTRMGVFATRSPFRPNSIGLSCVTLERVELTPDRGPILHVCGADLMDGTPILDIKPYIPYADAHSEAAGGFTDAVDFPHLTVDASDEVLAPMPENKREALLGVLQEDPRPSYQNDPERVYGFSFAGFEVRFRVENGILSVLSVVAEA